MNARRGPDALSLHLTGGWDNLNPDLSLGGYRSKVDIQGLALKITNPIPSIRIDFVSPAIGEGSGSLSVVAGQLVFTPPDDDAGEPLDIEEGQTRLIQGSLDSSSNGLNKCLRIYREPNMGFWGTATLQFIKALNGVLAMGNISDAQRQAGETFYRGIIMRAWGHPVLNIKFWLPEISGNQATYSIGLDDAVGQSLQEIPDENTAPSGVVFSAPHNSGEALTIASLEPGTCRGLWIKKVFPAAGNVDVRENVQLAWEFEGG